MTLVDELRSLRHEPLWWYRYWRFKRKFGQALGPVGTTSPTKRALLVSASFATVSVDLCLLKMLEVAGFETVAILRGRRHYRRYYRLAGAKNVIFLDDAEASPDSHEEAHAAVAAFATVEDVLRFEFAGARVGRLALSTLMRQLHSGTPDLGVAAVRAQLTTLLAQSMATAARARRILSDVQPDCAVFPDVVYVGKGELFDNCIGAGIPAIRWNAAHRNGALILKRYTAQNRDQHPVSLSADSWSHVVQMPWTDEHRAGLHNELEQGYSRGDWYGESGTQWDKRVASAADIRAQLDLDSTRPTAVIFPHILWDAPFAWGENLFADYEEWLIETVRVACANTDVNWVIKIHPANAGKQRIEGFQAEPAEVESLKRHVGPLPPHVRVMPASSPISTYSLLAVMDYCLTVRGTIGIEAASFGVPVLTAGSGRYERLGFTIDSRSREEYLGRVRRIHEIQRLTPAERLLAQRFAYGIFKLRPFPLRSVTLDFHEAAGASSGFRSSRILAADAKAWLQATDATAFAAWLNQSSNPDFLMLPPTAFPVQLLLAAPAGVLPPCSQ